MNKYLTICITLAAAIELCGCGDNKTTSKLIGTQVYSGNGGSGSGSGSGSGIGSGGTTTNGASNQVAVSELAIEDVLSSITMSAQDATNGGNGGNSGSALRKLIAKNVEYRASNIPTGGTYTGTDTYTGVGANGAGTVSITYSNVFALGTNTVNGSGTGSESFTFADTLGITYTDTVTVKGSTYTVTGTESDTANTTGNVSVLAGSITALSFGDTIKHNGTIIITGPGFNGKTYTYSLTDKGTISWATGDTNISGQFNITGTVAGQSVSISKDISFEFSPNSD